MMTVSNRATGHRHFSSDEAIAPGALSSRPRRSPQGLARGGPTERGPTERGPTERGPTERRTRFIWPATGIDLLLLLAFALTWLPPPLSAANGNAFPIVLVHGFTGWGPREMGGYHYWGGRDDIAQSLTEAGYETRVAVIGPVASNWDRACELYAYIKGGQVDYGAAHSQRYGHQRFGRRFHGLFPDWGQNQEQARVHLVGHSQGGQTIRVLASLLAKGDRAEQQATPPDLLHPLFQGGQPELVHSVTTLASPHDGTTLAIVLQKDAGYLLNWLLALAGHLSQYRDQVAQYDFKLDQWQLHRTADETDEDYRQRLARSGIWEQPDISLRDLRPEGARRLNEQYPAVDSIYYFSWAAQDNKPGPRGKGYQPEIGMNLALISTSLAISEFEQREPEPGLPAFAEAWWPNDGVVNTVSMSGPKLGSRDRIVNHAPDQPRQPFTPGIWHFLGVKQGWDHLDIIGQQTRLDYGAFYLDLARVLAALPAGNHGPEAARIEGATGRVE